MGFNMFCASIPFQYEYIYLSKICNETFPISFSMTIFGAVSNLQLSEVTAKKQVCYSPT